MSCIAPEAIADAQTLAGTPWMPCASSFLRSLLMWLSTVRSWVSPSGRQWVSSSARLNTRLGARIREASNLNSVRVRSSICCLSSRQMLASWLSRSIWKGPTRSTRAVACFDAWLRLSTACTRATTSAGLKGLTT